MQVSSNEADTIKSSSMLIYWIQKQDIYIRERGLILSLIKEGNEANMNKSGAKENESK